MNTETSDGGRGSTCTHMRKGRRRTFVLLYPVRWGQDSFPCPNATDMSADTGQPAQLAWNDNETFVEETWQISAFASASTFPWIIHHDESYNCYYLPRKSQMGCWILSLAQTRHVRPFLAQRKSMIYCVLRPSPANSINFSSRWQLSCKRPSNAFFFSSSITQPMPAHSICLVRACISNRERALSDFFSFYSVGPSAGLRRFEYCFGTW
ncbi:hypothetical protein V8C26DRAFT_290414 [Trichoderma gracile]